MRRKSVEQSSKIGLGGIKSRQKCITVVIKTRGHLAETSRKPPWNLPGNSAVSPYGHMFDSVFYLLKNPLANSYEGKNCFYSFLFDKFDATKPDTD